MWVLRRKFCEIVNLTSCTNLVALRLSRCTQEIVSVDTAYPIFTLMLLLNYRRNDLGHSSTYYKLPFVSIDGRRSRYIDTLTKQI
jgi:hypothetical protein